MPFTGPELCRLTASEIVGNLRRREVSPLDLIDAAEARTEAVDGAVNATVTRCFDRARDRAAGLAPDDHPGWLAGLPVGIKDLNEVRGVRTTFGNKALADNISDHSDPVVRRIEARGGLVTGKTNTPEFGAGANTFNDVFGRTRNPWDTRLNAGGSSGGAAAALATGQTWLSQGSDLAGSLRTPAAFCGVVGLRPSPGLVPGGSGPARFMKESVNGPMARTVRDCALFLDAMAGFDETDPLSFPPPDTSFATAVDRADGRPRIAWSADLGGLSEPSAEMRTHLEDALRAVGAAGATIEPVTPKLADLDRTYRVLRAMIWAIGEDRTPEAVRAGYKDTLRDNIQFGLDLSIDEVYAAEMNRSALYDETVALLADFDVLACPVVGLMPGPVEEEFPREIDGRPLSDYIEWLRFSFLAPTTTLPAISVPVGLGPGGMPVGLQLIGRPRGEARLLQAARAVEVATGGPLGPIDPVIRH